MAHFRRLNDAPGGGLSRDKHKFCQMGEQIESDYRAAVRVGITNQRCFFSSLHRPGCSRSFDAHPEVSNQGQREPIPCLSREGWLVPRGGQRVREGVCAHPAPSTLGLGTIHGLRIALQVRLKDVGTCPSDLHVHQVANKGQGATASALRLKIPG